MVKLDPHLLLVNKEYLFDPQMLNMFDMVNVTDSDGKTYVEQQTYNAFLNLKKYMEDEYGLTLLLTSAGRTIETQQKVLEEMIALNGEDAKKTTALPGQSEHHTGLALDVRPFPIKLLKTHNFVKDKISKRLANHISPTPAQKEKMYAVLHENLEKFGFILRYTKDKQEFTGYPAERWHIRYVGEKHAKNINQQNMCLEEYLEFLKSNQTLLGE